VSLAAVGASNGIGSLLHLLVQLVQQVAQLTVRRFFQVRTSQLSVIQLPLALKNRKF